jgi:hypothetical protein
VRRQDDPVELCQLRIFRRLLFEDVESGACDLARLYGFHDGAFIYYTAPGTVDYPHAFLHHVKLFIRNYMFGVIGKRRMNRYIIGLFQ